MLANFQMIKEVVPNFQEFIRQVRQENGSDYRPLARAAEQSDKLKMIQGALEAAGLLPFNEDFAFLTLESYIDNHKTEDTKEVVEDSEIAQVLRAMVEVLVQRRFPKRCSLVIWGPPNTGKTCLCNIFKEIFKTEEFELVPGSTFTSELPR
jgi:SpoVK/Ycf46/Vps4 family AAA+-type ATPase